MAGWWEVGQSSIMATGRALPAAWHCTRLGDGHLLRGLSDRPALWCMSLCFALSELLSFSAVQCIVDLFFCCCEHCALRPLSSVGSLDVKSCNVMEGEVAALLICLGVFLEVLSPRV